MTSAVDVSVCLRWLISGQTGPDTFLWEPVFLSLPVLPPHSAFPLSFYFGCGWRVSGWLSRSPRSASSLFVPPPNHRNALILSQRKVWQQQEPLGTSFYLDNLEKFFFCSDWTGPSQSDLTIQIFQTGTWRGFNSGATTGWFLWWRNAWRATDGLKVITSNQFKNVEGVVEKNPLHLSN